MIEAVYLMALLGCGEGEEPCRQIAVIETRYESREACTAATEAILARTLNADHPIIVAQCHEAGVGPTVQPQEVMLPELERTSLRF